MKIKDTTGKCCQLITDPKTAKVRTCKKRSAFLVRDDGRKLCAFHLKQNERIYGAYK